MSVFLLGMSTDVSRTHEPQRDLLARSLTGIWRQPRLRVGLIEVPNGLLGCALDDVHPIPTARPDLEVDGIKVLASEL